MLSLISDWTYNAVDIAAAAIIIAEIVMGLRRKMAGEVFRLLCTALVLAGAWRYYTDLGNTLAAHTRLVNNPDMAYAIAYGMLIAMLGMFSALLHLIAGLLVKVEFHPGIDRIGGALAGLMRGALIIAMLVFAAGLWPENMMRETFRHSSLTGRIVWRAAPPAIRGLRAIKLEFEPEPADNGNE